MGDSVNLMVKRGVRADPRSWNNPVTPMMTEWSTQVSMLTMNRPSIALIHSADNWVNCSSKMMLMKMQYKRVVFKCLLLFFYLRI